MPNCFHLFRKSAPEAGPVSLNRIDEELCRELGVEVHPRNWVVSWYDIIGFKLAMGRTWTEIRAELLQTEEEFLPPEGPRREEHHAQYNQLLTCLNYLRQNFTISAWAEIGRR